MFKGVVPDSYSVPVAVESIFIWKIGKAMTSRHEEQQPPDWNCCNYSKQNVIHLDSSGHWTLFLICHLLCRIVLSNTMYGMYVVVYGMTIFVILCMLMYKNFWIG